MHSGFPPLTSLLSDDRERNNFVAFASSNYAQVEVLFLCSVWDYSTTLPPRAELAQAIFNEYVSESGPHKVALQSATRKGVEKGLKKPTSSLFDKCWQEVERGLTVYREYEPVWVREHKVDVARKALIGEIDFDLKQPPSLMEMLASEKVARQLRVFAESIFCEEIVSFFTEVQAWKKNCDAGEARALAAKYIDDEAAMSLNLEHEVRVGTARGARQEKVAAEVFDEAMHAVSHQMQQNLYFQFLAHLRAIQKEMQSREKLQSLKQQKGQKLSSSSESAVLADLKFQEPLFEEVMADPIQLQDLLSFAGRTYNQERVVFYILVQDFRVQTNSRIRAQMAKKLFDEYILDNSKRQVSLEGRRHAQLLESYRQLCAADPSGLPHGIGPAFFDAAEKEISRSIKHEIFSRFVASRREAWEAAAVGSPRSSPPSSAEQLPSPAKPKSGSTMRSPRQFFAGLTKSGKMAVERDE